MSTSSIESWSHRSKSCRELRDGVFEALRSVGCSASLFSILPARHGAACDAESALNNETRRWGRYLQYDGLVALTGTSTKTWQLPVRRGFCSKIYTKIPIGSQEWFCRRDPMRIHILAFWQPSKSRYEPMPMAAAGDSQRCILLCSLSKTHNYTAAGWITDRN